jgi:Mor family transcriptional regulator
MENEIWKSVVGYEGWYEVSSFGSVRSVDRTVIHGRYGPSKQKGKVLSHVVNHFGYCMVVLTRQRNRKMITVHKLVVDAFIPNVNGSTQVDHLDADKQNNRLSNLERVTNLENNRRARAKHIYPEGERVHTAKLTAEKVIRMRKQFDAGATSSALSKEYQIDASHIGKICRRLKWKHVKDEKNEKQLDLI